MGKALIIGCGGVASVAIHKCCQNSEVFEAFDQLREAAQMVCSQANVVACDVNELSPHYDPSGISAMAACKMVREMLLAFPE